MQLIVSTRCRLSLPPNSQILMILPLNFNLRPTFMIKFYAATPISLVSGVFNILFNLFSQNSMDRGSMS